MPLVPMKKVLDRALKEKYALGAFNVVNLAFLEAIVEAAEELSSPVILNIAEVHFPFVCLENIVPAIKAMAERSPVDIVLNLDHGLTRAAIDRSLANGFTSIMFDGSGISFEENKAQTRQITELCHPLGVSVEAELGAVGGAEGGELLGHADPSRYTSVDQVEDFVKQTKIDALAVAIGNSHGRYKGPPCLDFDRLAAIREAAGIPLVLHGGSGISPEDFKRAISLGITKINFYTGMSQAALRETRNFLSAESEAYNDFPLMEQQIKAGVKRTVMEQMEIFGSVHKNP